MSSPAARPRVLVFAYACEPAAGSEPGAGWAMVQAVSEFADCVVLVGPTHAAGLHRWQAAHPGQGPAFVIVPEAAWICRTPPGRVAWFVAYLGWLRHAHVTARRLHAERPFDVAYHASYSSFWLPTPAVRLGVPSVWGPVGGAATTPPRLWPVLGWRGMVGELVDFVAVRALASLPATRRTWRLATRRIVQNEATLAQLPEPLRRTTLVLNHAVFVDAGCVDAGCVDAGSVDAGRPPRPRGGAPAPPRPPPRGASTRLRRRRAGTGGRRPRTPPAPRRRARASQGPPPRAARDGAHARRGAAHRRG